MIQVQVTGPRGQGEAIVHIARDAGIPENSIHHTEDSGSGAAHDIVVIAAENRAGKNFMDRIITASFYNPMDYLIVSIPVMSVLSSEKPYNITQGMFLPSMDIFQDLLMRVHISPSFLTRSIVSAILLAYGMIRNQLPIMIAALLFTQFMSQSQAVGFGLTMREWPMVGRGLRAFLISTMIALGAGALVAALAGGPLEYTQSNSLLVNFLISAIVAVAGVMASIDSAGRRELIGLAAEAQFAGYPVWLGIRLVLGLPSVEMMNQRLLTFMVNLVTLVIISSITYWLVRYRPEVVQRYTAWFRGK